jgi:hypothetical protein
MTNKQMPFCSYCGGSGGTMLLSNPPQWQPCFKCNPENTVEEKLPEVGREYFNNLIGRSFEVQEIKEIRDLYGSIRTMVALKDCVALYNIEDFFNYFEEVPSTNQQEEDPWLCNVCGLSFEECKKNMKKNQAKIEVEKAMEELKKELIETEATINRILKVGDWCPNVLIIKAQNLLNALESLDDSNIPEKGDCGIVEDTRNSQKKHPIQPIILDDKGTARFKENKIVSYLLDKTTKAKICDLNDIAIFVANGTFSNEDQEQLAQLIGYSVGGAADLSYMSDEIIDEANRQAESLMNKNQVEEEKKSEESSFKHAKNCSCKNMGNNTILPCRACVTETINEAMKQSEEEKGEADSFVYEKTQYECPKHGEHENFLQSKIMNKEGVWCNICVLEKLDELGINRMTKIKKLEEKK